MINSNRKIWNHSGNNISIFKFNVSKVFQILSHIKLWIMFGSWFCWQKGIADLYIILIEFGQCLSLQFILHLRYFTASKMEQNYYYNKRQDHVIINQLNADYQSLDKHKVSWGTKFLLCLLVMNISHFVYELIPTFIRFFIPTEFSSITKKRVVF